jgi:hypothetical protein
MFMKTLFFAFAVAAATLLSGMSAQAGVAINGNFTFATTGLTFSPDPNGATYNTFGNTSGSFTASGASGQSSDFIGGPALSGATLTSFTISSSAISTTLTVNFGNYGSFTGTLDSGSYGALANNAVADYTGTFTPGSAFSGFVSTNATMNLSFSRTGTSPNVAYGVLGTVATAGQPAPPSAVPEPASMAIFGLGALGFAARRFRRK